TSLPRARSSCREARASARTGAASRTGMMMLMGRDADICGELYARRYNAAMNQVQVPLPPLGNHFTDSLPGDPDTTNRPRQVQGACWSPVRPKGFANARLLAWSREVGEALGFRPDTLGEAQFTAFMSGSALLPGLEPYAQCYGGHQFGHWAGQLGDGRAINLGEITDREGQHQILQLKGAGPTPYSRTADGLAVLRS